MATTTNEDRNVDLARDILENPSKWRNKEAYEECMQKN